jgi:hypothetical protein
VKVITAESKEHQIVWLELNVHTSDPNRATELRLDSFKNKEVAHVCADIIQFWWSDWYILSKVYHLSASFDRKEVLILQTSFYMLSCIYSVF